ncbi:MAG: clan AA aspartic protease [Bacteroidetes bacterium]|nr:clan AA aspartic protease [Bacteroidota bacterium]
MGLVTTEIKLSNPKINLEPLVVECLVDSGALHLCIPETLAIQLKLEEHEKRPVTLANGSTHLVSYVGPIKLLAQSFHCRSLVMGNQVLLGAIPMEDMDVMIHPATRTMIANPQHPNIPASVAMGEGK